VEPILAVRGLKTEFATARGVLRAVDGVSFDVYAGQTLGIVGESGCGKSVTAHSILRIVAEPGRVSWGSQDVARRSPLYRLCTSSRNPQAISWEERFGFEA